jgi:uncharacterized membrane protein HdeD (DUF308 family)
MTASPSEPNDPGLSRTASVFIALEGVVALVFGVAAIAFPFVSGIAVTIFVGWVLVASGVVGVAGSVGHRRHLHIGWSAVSGVLAIVAGLLIALRPISGASVITFVVGAWLALDGAASVMIASNARRAGKPGWAWLIASAIIDWLLALAILFLSPAGSVASVGLVVGLDLTLAGGALVLMSAPWRRKAAA